MRPWLPLLFVALAPALQAQKVFNDSLYALAGQITERLAARGYSSVAVAGLDTDGGLQSVAERIENELTYGLVAQGGEIRVVERALLDLLLNEQRLSASGLINNNTALALGELIQADALISGKLSVEDKKHVRLELKLLNTTTGVVEGMWRSVLPAPEPVKAEAKPVAASKPVKEAKSDPSGPRLDLGVVGARYFGQERPGAMLGITFTGGAAKPVLTLGLRLQWMPVGSYLPRQVGFGLYTTPGANYSSGDHGQLPEDGDLFLVHANDLTYGITALSGLMAAGARNGTWRQAQVTASRADRFSLLVPFRLYLGRTAVRPYVEAGIGFDLVTSRNTYEVTSVTFAGDWKGEYQVDSNHYTADGAVYEGASRTFSSTGLLLGAGVEVGRLSLQMDLFRPSNTRYGSVAGTRQVKGDPMAIALLNGPGLEESRVLGELEQDGGILIGNTGGEDRTGTTPVLGRFLSTATLQLTLAYHF